ncbi:MAG: heme biosynthesis protein HemY [Rhodoferax sp.]|nr:heme biosynthesis protein HemY [Rhodoferax sp.]MBP6494199.1 heme biosynthesis protein HemY [Rhodoferax sp.]MBP7573776.1 heme biosynthesis protein HemY [Rhodoferax sp.]MBP8135421.1 heme biosynthesis protein HemY [Rhodoferax sp.]
MRNAIWLLALFCMAVAGALFAGNNESTITIFWPPYRVDLSLNLVILGLLVLFFVLHLALRALAALFAMPGEARRWRLQHKERAMHVALLDSLSNLLAGRFIRARRAAEQVLVQEKFLSRGGEKLPYAPRLRAISHLLVGESAHALQDKVVRDEHYLLAMEQVGMRDAQEARDGVQLRSAHWALHDHNATTALKRLDELPVGTARRTLALRLRLRAARMARRTGVALETARLLAKHGAFSAPAAQGVLRSLALELIAAAHDEAQLRKAWEQLEDAERTMPEVATAAAERALMLGADVALSRSWLLPVWERVVSEPSAMSPSQRARVVQVLEDGFAKAAGAPDAAWLTRIETAQMSSPGDALLQYLAGITCMHLQLWGKAQQLLTHSLAGLKDEMLCRNAWRSLAEMAQRRGDGEAAAEAYRNAAKR